MIYVIVAAVATFDAAANRREQPGSALAWHSAIARSYIKKDSGRSEQDNS